MLTPQEQDSIRIQEVREHAGKDDTYQNLKHVISNGFPNQRGKLSDTLKVFWGIKDVETVRSLTPSMNNRVALRNPEGLKELNN